MTNTASITIPHLGRTPARRIRETSIGKEILRRAAEYFARESNFFLATRSSR